MQSLAVQEVSALGGSSSVLARQKRDHVRLDRLLRRLGEVPAREHGPLLLDIYRLVFPHAFAEEAVLWPAIRRALPEGHELTLGVEKEHQAINELVARLEGLTSSDPARSALLDRIVTLLREDVRDEEDVLLPRLQAALTTQQLRRLGYAWEAVRRIAPTRAHPIVARRPPGNVLSALPLSLIDRSRDRIDRLRFDGVSGLDGVSAVLARAARAVEQLPLMRSGEDPATRRPRSRRPGLTTLAACTVGFALLALARRRRLAA